ncbi:16S rRNA (adenine(1518)-N(6)/adenine(1519)-N(6))-dimethyltransferase [Sphingomonadales bacterium EhC05]|uniref:16S rRNA (adenine(1518)-N(6)/adenine(1519)-N(6))- dimethyltransferase RsmA n=1 Tax=Parasphingorhabdus sp. TaxID=2709688 RepID=UPI0007F42394|nr:16S rRNA (adenine(1518)-N(6)/adenine(1519)-N(6))-dimethyltransferase [Sphingomonadales bacterium EhC05]
MSKLPPLPPLRNVIKEHGLSANKALGQNFLFDTQLLSRIAAVPGDLQGQYIFEVGPGPGGLTRALLQAGATVIAVERDARCLPALAQLADYFPGQLTVINEDALKIDLSTLFDQPFHIVSNLPYNIGSALLIKWLSEPQWPPRWQSLTLMFQREVAERIVGAESTDAYGRLSILAQWRCDAKLAMNVHRSAFTPPPKVMSAIVHLTPKSQPEGVDFKTLEMLTQAAFSQRRKMLRQSLKGVPGAIDALQAAGIDSARRPETVSVAEFVALARLLS